MNKILKTKFAETNCFNFNFLTFPKNFKDRKKYEGFFGVDGILNHNLESIDFPKYGLILKDDTASFFTEIFTGIFYEREDYLISGFFAKWNSFEFSHDIDNCANCDIELNDSSGETKAVYRVEGIFPINVSFVEKLSSDVNFQKVKVSFDFKKIYRFDK